MLLLRGDQGRDAGWATIGERRDDEEIKAARGEINLGVSLSARHTSPRDPEVSPVPWLGGSGYCWYSDQRRTSCRTAGDSVSSVHSNHPKSAPMPFQDSVRDHGNGMMLHRGRVYGSVEWREMCIVRGEGVRMRAVWLHSSDTESGCGQRQSFDAAGLSVCIAVATPCS